jgi:hypothetical protein
MEKVRRSAAGLNAKAVQAKSSLHGRESFTPSRSIGAVVRRDRSRFRGLIRL